MIRQVLDRKGGTVSPARRNFGQACVRRCVKIRLFLRIFTDPLFSLYHFTLVIREKNRVRGENEMG